VLERHRAEIVRIECDDAGVLLDVDTREDLRGLD
jgi:CTP:molybdopterin cytidylyltransferase MocA